MSTEALNRSLGRIEGKQDLILTHIDRLSRDHDALKQSVDGLNGRVSRVEKKLVWWAGAAATLSAFVYFFKDKITGVFQ
jgi:hypothetical protein